MHGDTIYATFGRPGAEIWFPRDFPHQAGIRKIASQSASSHFLFQFLVVHVTH
jgi:hypothetical protein